MALWRRLREETRAHCVKVAVLAHQPLAHLQHVARVRLVLVGGVPVVRV